MIYEEIRHALFESQTKQWGKLKIDFARFHALNLGRT